jgi:TonB family protein
VFYPANREEVMLLASLKDLVSSGAHRLDPMLAAIADAARRLTNASGSAIAMWKDGVMVCRARSGETAPGLGAHLDAKAGISGECLRTGLTQHCVDTENNPLVDVEVCRNLGLRSIAVLPIRGWRGVNGILEVFSTLPGTFSEHQLALLAELTALAERARASQPHGASQVVVREYQERPRPSGILPASDRVGDVALARVGMRWRPVVIGAIGVAAIALVALAIWLGWRGPDQAEGKAHAASPAIAATVTARPSPTHLPDNDPVWKPNPGGEPLFPGNGKMSAGSAVKLASKTDVIEVKVGGKKSEGAQTGLSAEAARAPSSGLAAGADSGGNANAATTSPGMTLPSTADDSASADAPVISTEQDGSAALSGVLSAKATVPEFAGAISQGVSGGRLLHHVTPVYPAQAKSMRVEGRVVLSAMVSEDGRVGQLRVVEGPAVLADSAVEAVKHWRYEPFLLDGKAIKRETTITIDFKLPSAQR